MKYDRYTSDGLDALQNWLEQMQSFIKVKRKQLEEKEAFEKDYDDRIKNVPDYLKKVAE